MEFTNRWGRSLAAPYFGGSIRSPRRRAMSHIRTLLRLAVVMALLGGWGSGVLAQGTTTGAIVGTLTDSTGAVLPGVTLTLTGPNLQGSRIAVSDEQGIYRFRNVPPGSDYKLAAQL